MQYNKWEADGSICVQDSLSEVEPDLELELELEDAHDSRVVRESLSESDTMPCGSKKLAAPSLYGWSVDSVRVFCRCEHFFFCSHAYVCPFYKTGDDAVSEPNWRQLHHTDNHARTHLLLQSNAYE